MRKLRLILLSLLITYSVCFTLTSCLNLQDFAQDLATANVKLRGDLMLLSDRYKNNLSSLNYETYLNLLGKSEMKSNKGITKIINKADRHYFVSGVKTFHVVIYYEKFNAIIYDDANTSFIDKVKVLSKNDTIPDLKNFVHK